MNGYELKALRLIFAMTTQECAQWIALDGNEANWQQWENGDHDIPANVIETLLTMRSQRKDRIHAIISKINSRIGNNTMCYFNDLSSFQAVYPNADFLEWKIYQSVANELYAHDLERLC